MQILERGQLAEFRGHFPREPVAGEPEFLKLREIAELTRDRTRKPGTTQIHLPQLRKIAKFGRN